MWLGDILHCFLLFYSLIFHMVNDYNVLVVFFSSLIFSYSSSSFSVCSYSWSFFFLSLTLWGFLIKFALYSLFVFSFIYTVEKKKDEQDNYKKVQCFYFISFTPNKYYTRSCHHGTNKCFSAGVWFPVVFVVVVALFATSFCLCCLLVTCFVCVCFCCFVTVCYFSLNCCVPYEMLMTCIAVISSVIVEIVYVSMSFNYYKLKMSNKLICCCQELWKIIMQVGVVVSISLVWDVCVKIFIIILCLSFYTQFILVIRN